MTTAYERAGMTRAEITALSNIVAAVESADPMARAVAVDRVDVLAMVAVLDRSIDDARPPSVPPVVISNEAAWLRAAGMRVRLARVARGESQAELSGRSGVSRVTVGSIERADHPASVTAYARLASALGLPLAELLGGQP